MMTATICEQLQQADPIWMPYGPGDQDLQIVESLGQYEAEYAALRKGVGIWHTPFLCAVRVTGSDHKPFLHRMLTQQINDLQPGQLARSFLLARTGRVEADLLVLMEADACWLILNRFVADKCVTELERYVFSEDISFELQRDRWDFISLLGPKAFALSAAVGCDIPKDLEPQQHAHFSVQDQDSLVYRHDLIDTPSLHLLIPQKQAGSFYAQLVEQVGGLVPNPELDEQGQASSRAIVGRPVGWAAFNTARIEAGQPLFQVDFGPDCLPHETSLLDQAVSFTKGCYLGQEIVARMQSLGHPKRVLVGLRFDGDQLPICGAQVQDEQGQIIGAITSSTLSPLRGRQAIAIAMMKWGKHRKNTTVRVPAEGQWIHATVCKLAELAPETN